MSVQWLFSDGGRELTLIAMKACGLLEEGQEPDEAELERIVPLVAREDTLEGTLRVIYEHYGLPPIRRPWWVRLHYRLIDLGVKALKHFPDYCRTDHQRRRH